MGPQLSQIVPKLHRHLMPVLLMMYVLAFLDRSNVSFAKTGLAQPGIDTEVLSVLFLAGTFLWPVWARSHARTAKERERMAERFAREVLRLTLHGTLRPEKYPELVARLPGAAGRDS